MGFLLLAIFLVLMIIGVPIAFVIGIVALIGIIGIEYSSSNRSDENGQWLRLLCFTCSSTIYFSSEFNEFR